MPWFKIDDKFHSHKKTARCPLAAVGLWAVLGSWSADQLTDGFVPDYVVKEKAGRGWRKLAQELVEVGYWEMAEHDGDQGWRYHDWDEFNPSREQVEQERAAARERMSARRSRRDGVEMMSRSGRGSVRDAYSDSDPTGQPSDTSQSGLTSGHGGMFGRTSEELRTNFAGSSDDVRLPRPDPTRSSYGTTPPAPPEGGFRTRRRPTQPEPEPWESYPEIPPEDPIEEPRP